MGDFMLIELHYARKIFVTFQVVSKVLLSVLMVAMIIMLLSRNP